MTLEIPLTRGFIASVDDADFEWLSQWSWSECHGYAKRVGRICDGVFNRKTILMHRQIMGVANPLVEVDHINHNKLDNRRCNLRLCSSHQNRANRLLQSGSFSGYKGVQFMVGKRKKRWQARIHLKGKTVSLGYFLTKEEAAEVYNEAALKYFGEFACLNEVR